MDLPDPVVAAVVAAGIAALGYFGRLVIDAVRDWRSRRSTRMSRLLELYALLRAGRVAFEVQRDQAGRLAELLVRNHPDDLPSQPGFERLFSHLFPSFTDEEGELHGVIRGYTVSALYNVNSDLMEWLRTDKDFKASRRRDPDSACLARQLGILHSHLLLWRAKYENWIPDHPDHALVYLADEESHGLGFPKKLEPTLISYLRRFRVAVPG